jgi:rRNA maturation RNase YbeY
MIRFFSENIPYEQPQKRVTQQWLKKQADKEGFSIGDLNYIFCSDEYLLQVNRDYLQHDYYTDIITFDQSEEESKIEGDIFVSVDRVKDNANQINVEPQHEMKRVLAHGLLHLCGYGDKSDAEAQLMRQKEEEWIKAFPQ